MVIDVGQVCLRVHIYGTGVCVCTYMGQVCVCVCAYMGQVCVVVHIQGQVCVNSARCHGH